MSSSTLSARAGSRFAMGMTLSCIAAWTLLAQLSGCTPRPPPQAVEEPSEAASSAEAPPPEATSGAEAEGAERPRYGEWTDPSPASHTPDHAQRLDRESIPAFEWPPPSPSTKAVLPDTVLPRASLH